MTFKTYLVEDNALIRDSLVGFLEDVAEAEVVAHATREDDAVRWLTTHEDWDIAIVDLFLDQGNGLGILDACRNRHGHQKVIVLSNYATPDMRARTHALGADAFFDKSRELEDLLRYCQQVGQASRHRH